MAHACMVLHNFTVDDSAHYHDWDTIEVDDLLHRNDDWKLVDALHSGEVPQELDTDESRTFGSHLRESVRTRLRQVAIQEGWEQVPVGALAHHHVV